MKTNSISPPETENRNYGMYLLGVDCKERVYYFYLPKTQERVSTPNLKMLKAAAKDLIITAGYVLTRGRVVRLNRRINDLNTILRVRELTACKASCEGGGDE